MALRRRDKLALAFSPVFLRVALGLTFLWAGAGKLFDEKRLDSNEAAILTSMGVTLPGATTAPAATPAPTPPAVPLTTPPTPKPGAAPATDAPAPAMSPPAVPIPEQPRGNQPRNRQSSPTKRDNPARQITSAEPSAKLLANSPPVPGDQLDLADMAAARKTQATNPKPAGPKATPSATKPSATAPASGPAVRKLYDLALLLKKSSTPPASGGMALWPGWASGGSWPVTFAWAAALGEFVCGAALLVGLFTRISALGIVSIMLGAMWLTELGPAIQTGKTFLYLVPSREAGELFSVAVWQRWFWQLSLICSGIALAMLGPGPLSLDHGVFGSGEGGPPPKPAPKPEA